MMSLPAMHLRLIASNPVVPMAKKHVQKLDVKTSQVFSGAEKVLPGWLGQIDLAGVLLEWH